MPPAMVPKPGVGDVVGPAVTVGLCVTVGVRDNFNGRTGA